MQTTFKGMTRKQILDKSYTRDDGGRLVEIRGHVYTVNVHERVELANGNWTSTVVLESFNGVRIVVRA